MNKLTNAASAVARVKNGGSLMLGGFLQGGFPNTLVGALLEHNTAGDLFLISNDTGTNAVNGYQLMCSGRVSRVIASYIGANSETTRRFNTGESQVTLAPQGTLAERIRAGGAGLGGVLTPVGLGTVVEEGKQKITVDGREYLLETALRADVAFVSANVADCYGNLFMKGTTKNMAALMAAAADYVVAEVAEYWSDRAIDPELVTVPGVLVDAIVMRCEDGNT